MSAQLMFSNAEIRERARKYKVTDAELYVDYKIKPDTFNQYINSDEEFKNSTKPRKMVDLLFAAMDEAVRFGFHNPYSALKEVKVDSDSPADIILSEPKNNLALKFIKLILLTEAEKKSKIHLLQNLLMNMALLMKTP